jgi:putative transposase
LGWAQAKIKVSPARDFFPKGLLQVRKKENPFTEGGTALMPRIARMTLPGVAHHVTQRANRRLRVFFGATDFEEYRQLLHRWCEKWQVRILAYCLMYNHVHVLAIPSDEEGLARAIGQTNRTYALHLNRLQGWSGHLWQSRFHSNPLTDKHLLEAARYVELNPVRAKLVQHPEEWPWSSARAHLRAQPDILLPDRPLLELRPDWATFLAGTLWNPEKVCSSASPMV